MSVEDGFAMCKSSTMFLAVMLHRPGDAVTCDEFHTIATYDLFRQIISAFSTSRTAYCGHM